MVSDSESLHDIFFWGEILFPPTFEGNKTPPFTTHATSADFAALTRRLRRLESGYGKAFCLNNK